MIELNSTFLIIVAVCICHIYRSTSRQKQTLEENVEILKEKPIKFENVKADEGKEFCLVETNDEEMKTALS